MFARSRAVPLAGLVVIAILVLIAVAAGPPGTPAPPSKGSDGIHTVNVRFHENAGVNNERILAVGGLVAWASCTDYGKGRVYLSVGVKSRVNNASKALVLSQERAGEAETYAFKSSDFDRNFGWYDITGTDPYDTTGTFSYARPDGRQVTLTFKADQGTPASDCLFDGKANYIP